MLKFIIAFIMIHWIDALLGIVLVGGLVYLWRSGKKKQVKRIIYFLVCQAEQMLGSRTGPEKLAAVWAGIYKNLPWAIRFFFTQQQLQDYIEEAVKELKRRLNQDDVNLLNYADETQLETITKCVTKGTP